MSSKQLPWHKNDALFFQELFNGRIWEIYVAGFLAGRGNAVSCDMYLELRKDISENENYADKEDIVCNGLIFEVKSRNIEFTCVEDFPYDPIMVETVSGWKKKTRKPDIYVCVSRPTKAILILEGATQEQWVEVPFWDRTRRIKDVAYVAPKSLWRTLCAGRRCPDAGTTTR